MSKKEIRNAFKSAVFKRDQHTCRVCHKKYNESNVDEFLDAHHITDRNEIANGGYVKENGISVCKDTCHLQVEAFHISGGTSWVEGLHPDDLYRKIGSSKELAVRKSELLA